MLDRILAFCRTHHSWLAAAGLAGLALYHLSAGGGAAALSDRVTAAGVLGLRLYPAPPSK